MEKHHNFIRLPPQFPTQALQISAIYGASFSPEREMREGNQAKREMKCNAVVYYHQLATNLLRLFKIVSIRNENTSSSRNFISDRDEFKKGSLVLSLIETPNDFVSRKD